MKKFSILSGIIILLLQANIWAQDSDSAKDIFIQGKIADLKGDYITAVEDYLSALKYEDAAGIHFALSQVYAKLNRFKDAMTEINKALLKNESNKEFLMQKANLYINLGQTNEAVKVYQTLQEVYPDDYNIEYSIARLYEELNETEKAANMYEKISDEYGFDLDVLRRLYDIYANKNQYENCERVLEYILKIDPYDIQMRMKLASLYEYNNKYDESLAINEELFRLNPSDKKIQTNLVKSYFLTNQAEKGFESFANILGKDSLTYEEKVQMGEIYYSLISEEKPAIKITQNIFTEISKEYPDKWKPYFYLGMTRISSGETDFGDYFDKALQYADTVFEAYILIGYTYFEKGYIDRSYDVVSKAIIMYPDDFQLNYLYGLTLQRKGKTNEAVEYYEKALSINPNDISLLSTLGLIYNSMQRYEESNAMYQKALQIEPDNALILNNYAYNLAERGENLSRALDMSISAIRKDPNNANYLDTISWIYFKMKDYPQALKFARMSLELNASSSVVQEHMGDILTAMKDITNAIEHFQKSIELNPNNQSAKEKLETLKK